MVTGSTYFLPYVEKKRHFSIESGKLPVPVGVEYSCFSVNESENYDKYIELERYIKKRQHLDNLFQVHMDFDVIEITTKPHKTHSSLVLAYKKLARAMKELELVGRQDGFGSGGLHFHFDLPKMKTHYVCSFLRDLYVDMANRPYLNWIFNEPIDNVNANSFYQNVDSRRFITKLDKSKYFDFNTLHAANFSKKTKAIRYDAYTHTVELRIFDMVVSEKEFVAVLNFACNYYELFSLDCSSNYDQVQLKLTKENYNSPSKLNVYLDEFKELLHRLNLRYEDYITFIERNYNVRKQWGKSYLV